MIVPDRQVELSVLRELAARGGRYLAGVDEVGRGALAGPATVGIAVVSLDTPGDFPAGLRDSKLMTPAARTRVVGQVRRWADAVAVGHAGADVVNRWGIIGALRYAAAEALSQLDLPIAGVLLDGSHDWWTPSELPIGPQLPAYPVHMEVKGDARCAVVAAASVVAKVERDELMRRLGAQYPGYDWERNKGYSSPSHITGLRELGASVHHRTSWKLPGLESGK
ncbi:MULTISPECIES: ribonuclease HII [Trueperella]|uniref:Ribonuclease n=1 Tax=Trueperella abortisuis TaxID=445930 RepID=A0ABT9PHC8_9ACTO|nr:MULTISPECIES: ribonuclease HII [Trueperella]MDP9832122.1 ribonuclease HII [Trueperella abortisuis]